MDFVFDVIMLITQDIILNILGDYSNRLVMSRVYFHRRIFAWNVPPVKIRWGIVINA
jgi:hypothetical protein